MFFINIQFTSGKLHLVLPTKCALLELQMVEKVTRRAVGTKEEKQLF